ncbi:MAG: hypothetical protein KDE27_20205 [Planctomycetes bacterium]|nr:hypothetical protein [Planctomycetota bacterium]
MTLADTAPSPTVEQLLRDQVAALREHLRLVRQRLEACERHYRQAIAIAEANGRIVDRLLAERRHS